MKKLVRDEELQEKKEEEETNIRGKEEEAHKLEGRKQYKRKLHRTKEVIVFERDTTASYLGRCSYIQ